MSLLLVVGGIGVASPKVRDAAARFIDQTAKTLKGPTEKEAEQPAKQVTPRYKVASALNAPKVSKKPLPEAVGAGLKLRLLERRPPSEHNCPAVHFGRVNAVLTPVETDEPGHYRDSDLSLICGLSFEIAPHGLARYAGLVLKVRSGKMLYRKTTLPKALMGAEPLSKSVSWAIDLPIRMRQPLTYELYLAEANQPVTKTIERLQGQADPDEVAKTIAQDGIIVRRIVHRVNN